MPAAWVPSGFAGGGGRQTRDRRSGIPKLCQSLGDIRGRRAATELVVNLHDGLLISDAFGIDGASGGNVVETRIEIGDRLAGGIDHGIGGLHRGIGTLLSASDLRRIDLPARAGPEQKERGDD